MQYSVAEAIATHCNTLQHTATHCNIAGTGSGIIQYESQVQYVGTEAVLPAAGVGWHA